MSDTSNQKIRIVLGPIATALVEDGSGPERTLMLDRTLSTLQEQSGITASLNNLTRTVGDLKTAVTTSSRSMSKTHEAMVDILTRQRDALGILRDRLDVFKAIHSIMSVRFDKLDKHHMTTRGLIGSTFFTDEDLNPIFEQMDALYRRIDTMVKGLEADQTNALNRIDTELSRVLNQPIIPAERSETVETKQPDMIRMMDRDREL